MPPDALDLLQQSIAADSPATLVTATGEQTDSIADAASLSFAQPSADPVVLPKDASTRYWRSDARTDYYTLAQLWLAWTERDSNLREYREKAAAFNVGAIAIADRLGVLNFLRGLADGGERVEAKGDGEGGAEGQVSVSATATAAAPAPAEAGPSRPAQPKRKYQVNTTDREFCKKVGWCRSH